MKKCSPPKKQKLDNDVIVLSDDDDDQIDSSNNKQGQDAMNLMHEYRQQLEALTDKQLKTLLKHNKQKLPRGRSAVSGELTVICAILITVFFVRQIDSLWTTLVQLLGFDVCSIVSLV